MGVGGGGMGVGVGGDDDADAEMDAMVNDMVTQSTHSGARITDTDLSRPDTEGVGSESDDNDEDKDKDNNNDDDDNGQDDGAHSLTNKSRDHSRQHQVRTEMRRGGLFYRQRVHTHLI